MANIDWYYREQEDIRRRREEEAKRRMKEFVEYERIYNLSKKTLAPNKPEKKKSSGVFIFINGKRLRVSKNAARQIERLQEENEALKAIIAFQDM